MWTPDRPEQHDGILPRLPISVIYDLQERLDSLEKLEGANGIKLVDKWLDNLYKKQGWLMGQQIIIDKDAFRKYVLDSIEYYRSHLKEELTNLINHKPSPRTASNKKLIDIAVEFAEIIHDGEDIPRETLEYREERVIHQYHHTTHSKGSHHVRRYVKAKAHGLINRKK